mmetsp:Transcript_89527/g.261681  ORF Transcript_89527/g.261681 Transcript_89527/m.261681 type:complete len:220 (-) Transcript_89527:2-661(-)
MSASVASVLTPKVAYGFHSSCLGGGGSASFRASNSAPLLDIRRLTQPELGPLPSSFSKRRRSPCSSTSLTAAPVASRGSSCADETLRPCRTTMPPLSAPPTTSQTRANRAWPLLSRRPTQPVSGPVPVRRWKRRRPPCCSSSPTKVPVDSRSASCLASGPGSSRTMMPPLSAPATTSQTGRHPVIPAEVRSPVWQATRCTTHASGSTGRSQTSRVQSWS